MIFQHFQDTAHGFAGTTYDLTDFLTGDFDLHTVWVGHRIRLFSQIQQSLGDTSGHVQECQVAHFFRCDLQTTCHLRRQAHQDVWVNLNQLTEFFIRDFSNFTSGFCSYPCAAFLAFFKQA